MVLGGNPEDKDVELVDFRTNRTTVLAKPYDLQFPFDGGVSNVIDGAVWFCAGRFFTNCYFYSFAQNYWYKSDTTDKTNRGATEFVLDNKWYIMGGWDQDNNTLRMNTTVVLQAGVFSKGQELPYPASSACSVLVNSTHIFFAGGADAGSENHKAAYLVDVGNWEWTRLEDMARGRNGHTCGRSGGKIVALGGSEEGSDGSEIFSLDTMTWSDGPDIPTRTGTFDDAPHVYQLKDTFYVLGGWDGDHFLDTVFEFEPRSASWLVREETLKTARSDHGLVAIPSRIID